MTDETDTLTTDPAVTAKVQAGSAWMASDRPGWYKQERIRVGHLDMGSGLHCVMGQTYGAYADGLDALCATYPSRMADELASELGFYVDLDVPNESVANPDDWIRYENTLDDAYQALTNAWIEEIYRLRKADREAAQS